jgi:hypothetical protein
LARVKWLLEVFGKLEPRRRRKKTTQSRKAAKAQRKERKIFFSLRLCGFALMQRERF